MALPDTECPLCFRAELKGFQRVVARVEELVGIDPMTGREYNPFAYMGSTFRAIVGGKPPKSWYERHRDAFIATGETVEMERMIRHVSKGGDPTWIA